MEGVESVGFSPDRHPGFRRRGVVAFVVFRTVEQRDAALVDQRVCWALLGTEFQLENRMVHYEAKSPELNTALDKRDAEQIRRLINLLLFQVSVPGRPLCSLFIYVYQR